MVVRPLRNEEKELYNSVVSHPVQSWEWGDFRHAAGHPIERIGFFEHGKLVKALQVTFHKVPLLGKNVGYYPKGFTPDEDQLRALQQLASKHNAIFIKMEPNIWSLAGDKEKLQTVQEYLIEHDSQPGKYHFSRYSFILDLSPDEDTLFANLHSKTRYNVNLAIKKGVQIFENSTEEGIEQHIQITEETTKRKGFYAHDGQYFRTMWNSLGKSGMLRIFHAVYQDTIVVSWVVFQFNGVLYYPYGASRDVHRDVMASNLMMWEMIHLGKQEGCTSFDMWGSLGPEPDKKDPWYGFHRFKKGYGGDLVEYVGSFDLVADPPQYKLFKIADYWRWKYLRFRSTLGI